MIEINVWMINLYTTHAGADIRMSSSVDSQNQQKILPLKTAST